jgi:glycine oxidase
VRSRAPSIASENIFAVTGARNLQRVAVVGGGIAGAFAAYFLARLGARPTLIERGGIGGQASGRSAGNLAPCHGVGIPGPLQKLALASFRLHLEHAPQVGVPLHPTRRLHVALDDADAAALEAGREPYDETPGFSARWVDAANARALEPRLTPDLVGGLLVEGNRRVDGGVYTKALVRASGATVLHAEALGLEQRGDRAAGVVLETGLLPCDAVVIATGPWCDWHGLPLPVEPVKGELLLVEVPGGAPTVDLGRGKATAYQADGSRVLLGDTEDRAGFDDAPTAAARARILAGAATLLPALAGARVVAHTAGLRPVTPDGLPIVGHVEGWGNVCVATGAGRKGILLSAGLGIAVAEVLVRDETALPIGPCSPTRFVGATAA